MFQDGACDPGPPPSYSRVAAVSFGRDLPFRAAHAYSRLVSGSFHPPSGVLFSFPSPYWFAIGLGTYLALEVGAPLLPAPKSRYGTLGLRPSPSRITPTGLSPSLAGRSRPLRLLLGGGGRAPQPHIPPDSSPGGSVWAVPLSLAATQGIPVWFLFLPLLGCFRSGGSRSLPGAPRREQARRGRKSHSGIPGSTAACAYPGLIAACHALLRRPSRAIHQAAWRAGSTRGHA